MHGGLWVAVCSSNNLYEVYLNKYSIFALLP